MTHLGQAKGHKNRTRPKPKDDLALVSCVHYTAYAFFAYYNVLQGAGLPTPLLRPLPRWFVELVKQHFGLCPLREAKVS